MSLNVSATSSVYNLRSHKINDDEIEGVESQSDDGIPAVEETSSPKALRKRKIAIEERDFPEIDSVSKRLRHESKKVIGRAAEVERIVRMLSQPKTQRPLLIGPSGVGKSSIIKKVSEELSKDSCPASLKGRKIKTIYCKKLAADAESGQGAADVFADIDFEIKERKSNPIYFLKDIDELTNDRGVSLHLETLLSSLSEVVATISDSEKSDKVATAKALLCRHDFEPLLVNELSSSETEAVVRLKMRGSLNPKQIPIEDEAIKFAIKLAAIHLKNYSFPGKAISVISEATAEVSLHDEAKVEPRHVARVIASRTNIPEDELLQTDLSRLQSLHEFMRSQLVGQDKAVEVLFKGIRRGKLGFRDLGKPWGVYFFMGPTGVGKTELAKLAAQGLKRHFIRLDMSEYFEEHSAAKLIGSPPGYESNDVGGGFTNELRDHPESIVLIDEFEKAHPNVARVLLQVFDDGRLTDGKGVTTDCTNALFIMTSNLGSDTVFAHNSRPLTEEKLQEAMYKLIEEEWSPEFLSRISAVVPFRRLVEEDFPKVIEVHLKRLAADIFKNQALKLKWTMSPRSYFLEKYRSSLRTGVRGLCEKVKTEVFDALSEAKINKELDDCTQVNLSIVDGKIKVMSQ